MISAQPLLLYLLRLGAVGFGGPVALVARMEHDLVEQRRWFSLEEFRDGLALAQIAPGPLAAQLAVYLGWLRGGAGAAALAGMAFVLPSFLMVAGLTTLYLRYDGLTLLRDAFYGVGAVVVALLARGALRLFAKTTAGDRTLLAVATLNGVVVAITGFEYVSLLFLSGCIPLALDTLRRRARPEALVAFAPLATDAPSVPDLLAFFAKSSMVVFGSGLAILPYLRAEVVLLRGWITEPQFLDAIAVSMLTPGPVVITVTFIGWLVAGPAGGVAATLGVFTPTVLVVIVAAPVFQRLRHQRAVRLIAAGVTAAASGALAGAVVVIGAQAITDGLAAALAVLTALVLWRYARIPEPALILAGAVVGLIAAR